MYICTYGSVTNMYIFTKECIRSCSNPKNNFKIQKNNFNFPGNIGLTSVPNMYIFYKGMHSLVWKRKNNFKIRALRNVRAGPGIQQNVRAGPGRASPDRVAWGYSGSRSAGRRPCATLPALLPRSGL